MKLIKYIPFRVLLWLGRRVGDLIYIRNGRRKKIAAKNIDLVFPDLSERKKKVLLLKNLQSTGMGIMESLYSWYSPRDKIKSMGTVYGLENIPENRGVILVFSHFTSLEICNGILSQHIPMNAMYKASHSKFVNRKMVQSRDRYTKRLIPHDDIRAMVNALKNKEKILYAIDQHGNSSNRVYVDFFGIPAATTAATSRLTKITKAVVIPISTIRTPDYKYEITIYSALENFGDTPLSDTQTLLSYTEADAKKYPAQYLWIHRRFKSQPDGTKNLYEI